MRAIYHIYTIGYGNSTPDAFFALLPDNAIIVDVRANPYSAWNSLFTYRHLSQRLAAFRDGTRRYVWIPELGNRSRRMPPTLVDEAKGLEHLKRLARDAHQKGRAICLLCAEGNPLEPDGVTHRCHRAYIAQHLAEALGDAVVVHLTPSSALATNDTPAYNKNRSGRDSPQETIA